MKMQISVMAVRLILFLYNHNTFITLQDMNIQCVLQAFSAVTALLLCFDLLKHTVIRSIQQCLFLDVLALSLKVYTGPGCKQYYEGTISCLQN